MSSKKQKQSYKYKYIDVYKKYCNYEDAQIFESIWSPVEKHHSIIAYEAGSFYWKNFNGLDAYWPKTFRIWTEDGQEIGVFQFDVNIQPHFKLTKIENFNQTSDQ